MRRKAVLTDQSWWISHFATRPQETALPLLRPRSKVYLRKSKTIRVEFPAAFEQGLKAAGFVKPALLNRLCLAGLAAILYRYTGSREPETIVLGSPATLQMNGGRAGDVLPLLIQVALDLPFASLLDRVAIVIDDSNQRAGFSLNELIAALGLNETQNPQPLFSTVLRVAGYHAPQSSELRNDVNVTVSTSGDCGMFELEYNANVHEAETVQRMAGHLLHFLEHAVVDSQGTIGSIEFLGCSEREQLLNQWSIGKVKPRQERCLHELVEEQAKENPEREALVFGNQTLSYAQLNSKSNQLAHYLLRLGVKRGTPVGLCLPAGESLLYGLLGILKSGATVVPLVPTFPAFRNAMGIEDSKMEVTLTTSPSRTSFGEKQPNLVCLDLVAEEIARESTDSPVTGISADDILYVLFTSGSTGRPKGVAMSHRTVVNLIHWQRERGADPAGQRTLQRTSIGFDVSFQEIFSTWAFGGSLAVAPDDVRDDVSLLPEFIARYGISRVFLPPVALDQLAAAAAIQRHSLATLQEVIVAGEQLRVSMAIRRFFHDVNCTLDNQYGPTETHVATAHSLAGASTRWPASPPIGMPVDNVRAYILDSQFHLVPAGVPGQICIGGVGPAKGYLREEETEEKFVADPFSVEPGARMYLTGDLGRFLSDGTMEFLGRVDHQVKIRGYRIELGDIEANLLKVPGIRHAAVEIG